MWGVNQDPKDSKESPLYAPGTQVLIKVWKDGSPKAQLQPMKGPLPCKTFYPHSTQGTHESSHRRKQKKTLNTLVSPLGDLRTTNECHSNEHPQNLVSGDKISQDSSKEPTQLGRDCTPKQTGDRSSDP